jgi:hypothetical protein
VLIEDVRNLSPVDRFLYWIRERDQIYRRRKVGKLPPWTDDTVMQKFWFTNPYRENDKTTAWFRTQFREPMRSDVRVLLGTIVFRWFNRIDTGQILLDNGLLHAWDKNKAIHVLSTVNGPVFTGAFVIAAPTGMSKIEGVCTAIEWLKTVTLRSNSLQGAWKELRQQKYLGDFMAYEVVSDLRHTSLLDKAHDTMTWCNVGPGCLRGLRRVLGMPVVAGVDHRTGKVGWMYAKQDDVPNALDKIEGLLSVATKRLRMRFEMRDIEHSLCEFDKYERASLEQGTTKKYGGKR